MLLGLSRWLRGKESSFSAGDTSYVDLISGLGRSLGGGRGNPLQYSCLENCMDRGNCGAVVTRVAKNWTQLK